MPCATFASLSTDVLFSQKIVERANENNKPRDMTVDTNGWGGGGGGEGLVGKRISAPLSPRALRSRSRVCKIFREKIKRLWID